ncbi:MAG: hypothetical protein ACI8TQ_000683 [Planctomycetota bacterium]|jgi:hypothetical protein
MPCRGFPGELQYRKRAPLPHLVLFVVTVACIDSPKSTKVKQQTSLAGLRLEASARPSAGRSTTPGPPNTLDLVQAGNPVSGRPLALLGPRTRCIIPIHPIYPL